MNNEILKEGTKISKNKKIKNLIDDPLTILKLSNSKKSIYVKRWKRTSPASFILSMQFRQVISWMNSDDFYEIENIN